MTFKLHPQLAADCFDLGELKLCRLLLMNDNRYPWIILVPQRNNITEIFQLAESDQIQLAKESIYLSRKMADVFSADKMNVAALGNVVSQLHIHHVVRYETDTAWPAPIWGLGEAIEYEVEKFDLIKSKVESIFNGF
ncbi:MAG: HIT domain-containing protein [Gammaproteobacteria bacterium]